MGGGLYLRRRQSFQGLVYDLPVGGSVHVTSHIVVHTDRYTVLRFPNWAPEAGEQVEPTTSHSAQAGEDSGTT